MEVRAVPFRHRTLLYLVQSSGGPYWWYLHAWYLVRRRPRLVRALKGYRDIQLNLTSGTGCADTIWQIVPIMTSLKRGRV